MIDLVLFAGRILLVVFLYLFLFAVMRTGIGLVRGQRRDAAIWCLDVDKGPRALRGLHVDMLGPVIVGRSPSSDVVISEPYVSATHARFTLQGPALVLEDLHSTNGTLVNGRSITQPVTLRDGDEIQVGDVVMRVSRR
ncbi:MAG: FHA domain-containing protein [Atopobiaceae bacterium]|nr:FHA domain-containing protein [Atopobiaceae bacterium]